MDIDKELLENKDKKGKQDVFDNNWVDSEDLNNSINIDDSIAELEDLLCLPKEGTKMVKKKKAAPKAAPVKKKKAKK